MNQRLDSLRVRLLSSYILVVATCLAVAAVALYILVLLNPLPRQAALNRLNTVADVIATRLEQVDEPSRGGRLVEAIRRLARTQNLRILLLDADNNIVVDSVPTSTNSDLLRNAQITHYPDGSSTGRFIAPDGRAWIFVTRPWTGASPSQSPPATTLVVGEREASAFNMLLRTLGTSAATDVVIAGLFGLALSLLLAVIISQSVAGPLRRAAMAAQAIAHGQFNQTVPVSGPSEVRELLASFNHMAHQVQLSQQSQRDFVANVSHEMKTPLTSIQGFSQAILDGTVSDPPAIQHAATIIHEEAVRMRRLVEGLLDLARFDAGQVTLNRTRVDLVQLLQAAVDRFSLRASEANVRLQFESQPVPPIQGDGDRLAQVVNNLLDNALKFTSVGGQITVAVGPAGPDKVQFSVTDTGGGIPAEHLERIFERFYQVDRSRRRSTGSGLGLAISREIIHMHGGEIRAESIPGLGTKFTVTMPGSYPLSAVGGQQSAPSTVPLGMNGPTKKLRPESTE